MKMPYARWMCFSSFTRALPKGPSKGWINCKIVVRYGVGVDNMSLEALKNKGIPLCNTPDYGIEEIARPPRLISSTYGAEFRRMTRPAAATKAAGRKTSSGRSSAFRKAHWASPGPGGSAPR